MRQGHGQWREFDVSKEVIINESKQPTVTGNETLREVFCNTNLVVLSFLSRKSCIQFIIHKTGRFCIISVELSRDAFEERTCLIFSFRLS